MTWYRLIMGSTNTVERPLLATEAQFWGVDPYELTCGKRIHQWNPASFLRAETTSDDGDPDDVLGEAFDVPTFSQRLRDALVANGIGQSDIQYLPVHVFKSTGEEVGGFAIANVISRVIALDRGKCYLLGEDPAEVDPLTNMAKVKYIGRIALRRDALVGHDIIRLTEFVPPVLVSERFAAIFTAGHFTGGTLTPVEVGSVV